LFHHHREKIPFDTLELPPLFPKEYFAVVLMHR